MTTSLDRAEEARAALEKILKNKTWFKRAKIIKFMGRFHISVEITEINNDIKKYIPNTKKGVLVTAIVVGK